MAETGGQLTAEELATSARLGPRLADVKLILREKMFVALVSSLVDTLLNRDGRRAAVHLLLNVARDENQGVGHRIRAAELILSRTMPTAQHGQEETSDRDLSDMSADELRRLVDGMQTELSDRAAPVVIEADPADCLDV